MEAIQEKNYIQQILLDVSETINKKNHDYDHAFHKSFNEIGSMYAVGKIFEKYSRIKKLTQTPAMVDNEGLEDALKDCIGYCTLYLNELRNK